MRRFNSRKFNSNRFNRRSFLTTSATLAAGGTLALPSPSLAEQSLGVVVDEQPFARLLEIGKGVWAVASTPLDANGQFAHAQTLCNGGLIAGKDKVLAVEAFLQPQGAAWLAEQALKLTGKRPTDVIVTHFHADHSGGLAGFQQGAHGPEIIMTETTRKLINERYGAGQSTTGEAFARPATRVVGPTQIIQDETQPVSFDLGGRKVTLEPLSGHTPSDVAIHVDDLPITFAGDLVWFGLFHNYVDAIPSKLRTSVEKLLRDPQKLIVSGHGGIAPAGEMGTYLELLNLVEDKAKQAHAAGKTAAEGAASFSLPGRLGIWQLFNPRYYETAFNAWYKELDVA